MIRARDRVSLGDGTMFFFFFFFFVFALLFFHAETQTVTP